MSTPELMQVIDELENDNAPVTAQERYDAIRKLQELDDAGNSFWSGEQNGVH